MKQVSHEQQVAARNAALAAYAASRNAIAVPVKPAHIPLLERWEMDNMNFVKVG